MEICERCSLRRSENCKKPALKVQLTGVDGMVGYIWGKGSGFVTTRDNVCEFVEIVGGDWGRFDGGGGGA